MKLACAPTLALLFLAPMHASVKQPPSTLIPQAQRAAAPDLVSQTPEGETMHLSDLSSRVVLVDFWATTCAGCEIEIPWYIDFEQRYNSAGLVALGIATDDNWSIIRPYLARKPIPYPVLIGTPAIEAAWKVQSLPMTLLIDRQGRIAAAHIGMVNRIAFGNEIQALTRE